MNRRGRKASDFHVGQRVRLTAYARQRGIKLKSRAGDRGQIVRIVAPLSVAVLPDNYKVPQIFHVDFWEPDRG